MDLIDLTSKKLLFFFFISLIAIQLADALVPTYVSHDCTVGSLDFDNENVLSLNSLLSDLVDHSSNSTFFSSTSGKGENKTYGFFYCTANVNSQDCHSCVQSAANDSQSNCESYRSAVVYYRECTLRYSDSPLSATDDSAAAYSSWIYSSVEVSYKQFNKTLYSTLETVITQAANGPDSKGFATRDARLVGTKERLYAFAQCTPDSVGSACDNCLRVALGYYQDCCDYSRWGSERTYLMIYLPNCQLSHEVRKPSSKGMVPSSLSSSSSSSSESEPESSSSSESSAESSSSTPSSRRGLKIYWYIVVAVVAAVVPLH